MEMRSKTIFITLYVIMGLIVPNAPKNTTTCFVLSAEHNLIFILRCHENGHGDENSGDILTKECQEKDVIDLDTW